MSKLWGKIVRRNSLEPLCGNSSQDYEEPKLTEQTSENYFRVNGSIESNTTSGNDLFISTSISSIRSDYTSSTDSSVRVEIERLKPIANLCDIIPNIADLIVDVIDNTANNDQTGEHNVSLIPSNDVPIARNSDTTSNFERQTTSECSNCTKSFLVYSALILFVTLIILWRIYCDILSKKV